VLREWGLLLDQLKAPRLASAPAPRTTPPQSFPPQISPGAILLLAAASGLIVANIYYAQPLIGPIAQSLGLAPQAAGLIVTMSQIGYGAGLMFIVPLGDLIENRKLILASVALSAIALAAAAFAPSAAVFLVCAGAIGLGSVAVQILVPLAAHLAPDATRGRVVGMVSSGLMIGIMLARPVSSFIAAQSSWRAVFIASAAMMLALAAVLARTLPVRAPNARMTYGALIASMAHLAAATPILRRRAFYQACLFFAFSLFWTTTPLLLAGPQYQLTQNGIALFALAGVSGAIAAPIAGRLADHGFSRPATGAAIALVLAALPMTMAAPPGSALALALLVAAAVAIDFGVQANLVLGFRAIFALAPEARGRLAVRRRRGRLSRRRLGLRARRLDACLPRRSCAAARRAGALSSQRRRRARVSRSYSRCDLDMRSTPPSC
jgi:predicted MFS family arabinose efflux permease